MVFLLTSSFSLQKEYYYFILEGELIVMVMNNKVILNFARIVDDKTCYYFNHLLKDGIKSSIENYNYVFDIEVISNKTICNPIK